MLFFNVYDFILGVYKNIFPCFNIPKLIIFSHTVLSIHPQSVKHSIRAPVVATWFFNICVICKVSYTF